MKIFLSAIFILVVNCLNAQNTFRALIKGADNREPLAGATVSLLNANRSFVADSAGLVVIENIAAGKQTLVVSHVGYEEKRVSFIIPQSSGILEIFLEEDSHEEEEVIVTSTRSSRTISNTPTRVEIISGEELEEKGNMKPGDIRMLLNESTGIQTQQTSATSYNSGIRIQGLDGRYTQLLRDGFPLYSGFSGSLSVMQIAPLDLKQVEVIKGSSSTLYGGGAIAGLVNLVSKVPTDEREISFLANATSAKGLDLSGFYSQKFNRIGTTLFISRNSSAPFDPSDAGMTAIPKFERYTVHPRLFIYGEKTNANVGINYTTEDRIGGSVDYIKGRGEGFFEKNNTNRLTTQARLDHDFNEKVRLTFKNSYSRFDRSIVIPNYTFDGLQQSSYSEISLSTTSQKFDWIAGANYITDQFQEKQASITPLRNHDFNTFGTFIQNTFSPNYFVTVEAGLRADYVKEYGWELLPRVSALFRFSPQFSSRIGGGMGYKTPTIFNEESERIQFRNVFPIDVDRTENERSIGANVDFNYRTNIGEVGFSINHLFFYTRLNDPLTMVGAPGGKVEFLNANGHLDSKGMETNLRFILHDFKLFVGYTYTDVNTNYNGVERTFPLTAKHRLNNVLMYEIEEKLKLGLEAYYFSPQKLTDGTTGRSYWITGFMAEKLWEKFSIFLNFENFTDTRQTKWEPIYTGPVTDPSFKDIYAPLDGFVVNGGIKIRL